MPTNKVMLRTTEEFMADYTPIYQPIYPLFMNRAQAYSEEVGTVNFRRVTTVGNIRAHHITPKDTEIKQINVAGSTKAFKKYFLANQYVESELQDQQSLEEVTAQVLDEHQKQADELLLFGEGTSDGTVINNGLFYSGDANHVTNSNFEVDTDGDPLLSMHTGVMSTVAQVNGLSGRKAIIFYGTNATTRFNGLYSNGPVAFKTVLNNVLGANFTTFELPTDVTPAGQHGWIICALDHLRLHYTLMPTLRAQGVNEEKMYAWFNFLMGSMMLEATAPNAIVRQPITIEA
jgi:hypothetical protein